MNKRGSLITMFLCAFASASARYIDVVTDAIIDRLPVECGREQHITATVKMPIADSRTRDITVRHTNPPEQTHARMGLVEETKGAPEKSICLPDGEVAASPTRKSQRTAHRVSQSESIDPLGC